MLEAKRERPSSWWHPPCSSRVARLTGDEEAYAHARESADATVRALTDLGYEARGHVELSDPLQATDEGLREFPADEIVFVLGGGDKTQWLEQGIVDLARGRYPVPVSELDTAARADGAPLTSGRSADRSTLEGWNRRYRRRC